MKVNTLRHNIHLLLSSVIVIGAALVYGLAPATVLPQLFDFQVLTPDLSSVFRAVMGLYLAFAFLWILGSTNNAYWKAATISQILFMGGLAAGRMLSLCVDGEGSVLFSLGSVGEWVLCFFGYFQWRSFKDTKFPKDGS